MLALVSYEQLGAFCHRARRMPIDYMLLFAEILMRPDDCIGSIAGLMAAV